MWRKAKQYGRWSCGFETETKTEDEKWITMKTRNFLGVDIVHDLISCMLESDW